MQPVLIYQSYYRWNAHHCDSKGGDETKQTDLIVTKIQFNLKKRDEAFHWALVFGSIEYWSRKVERILRNDKTFLLCDFSKKLRSLRMIFPNLKRF
jgi:hypothetical protein